MALLFLARAKINCHSSRTALTEALLEAKKWEDSLKNFVSQGKR